MRMSLRKQTLLIIGVTLIGLVGLLYFISQTILLNNAAELEVQNTRQHVERATIALQDQLAELNRVAGDWAPWDDTYNFIADQNEAFIESNISASTLLNLNVNLMLFFNPANQLVYGQAIDLQSGVMGDPPPGVAEHLMAYPEILPNASPTDSLTGILLLPNEKTVLFAAQPIVTSEQTGPIRGILVVGRYLNDVEIEALAKATRQSISIWPLNMAAPMPADFQTAQANLSPISPIFVQPLSDDVIAGYAVINDVYGQPALLLKVDQPRDIYRQSQVNLFYSVLLFLISGLIFGLVMVLLLEKRVLSRLTHLSQSVGQIGTSSDLSARVSVTGRDELTSLASEINKMLAALGRSDEALRKAHDELDLRVQQRTAELSETNQLLKQEIRERQQAEETLRQSESQFRKIVSSFSDHIYMTEITADMRRINHYLSQQVEILTGYPVEKFAGDWGFWPTVVIHPDDRASAARQAARLAEGHDSVTEYRLVKANGQIIWVRDSGRAETDAVNHSTFIYGLVSDITERKQAEIAIAHARDEALIANRLKSQLLANVSHDLRTPLNAILGYAEMLREGVHGSLSDRQKNSTERIMKNATHLTTLVNQLLDQAHLEAGTLKLKQATFQPASLVDNLKATMSGLAEAKGLQLTSEIDPDLPLLFMGDMDRLQQIMNNLVGNAIKFTEQGSVHFRLSRSPDGHWLFQVSDTGPGISGEAQPYIFDPFRQVDGTATRQHGGFGLGLSIVKQLVTLMGGQVLVESRPGQGSTFTVRLPLITPETEVIG